MTDVFGYNRSIKVNDQIVSSEFLTLTMGSRISLLQTINVNYQRDVQPVFQVGDSTVYFVHGHAQGQLQASRLVGKGGILNEFKTSSCGKISSLNVAINGGGACAVSGGGSVHFEGGLLQSVGFSGQAGQLQLAENASVIFGAMSS